MLDYIKARWFTHSGSKGLHLNPHGIAKFSMNLKVSIRTFWKRYNNSVHNGYQYFATKNYLSANCNYTDGNDDTTDLGILNDFTYKNLDRILIGHLNIDSLGNKFEILLSSIAGNLNICYRINLTRVTLKHGVPHWCTYWCALIVFGQVSGTF